jgi:hypothetical protein
MALSQLLLIGGIVLVPVDHAHAQTLGGGEGDPVAVSDSVRQAHTVHVSPHLVVLDPHSTTATLTFSNEGTTPTQADVELQYGFTDWPDTDLANPLNPHYPNPRDTVIRTPGPTDRYAGRWISGLPTHLTLQPHETQRVTLRIDPPAHLPAGEYSARVVTIVRPPLPPKRSTAQDTKQVYHLPVQASTAGLPVLRDSVRVFYRTGLLRLGVAIRHPTMGIGKLPADATLALKDDWVHLPVQLTGNMHFEGQIKHYFRNDDTGETVVALTTRLISLQRDGVIHHWCDVPANGSLPPGHYTLVVILDATQEEFPASQRIAMPPVQVSLPFELK